MKNRKFLLFAFILTIFATPFFVAFQFDDDLPDREKTTVVLVVGQEEREIVENDLFLSLPNYYTHYDYDKHEPIIYNDAVQIHSKYLLTNPTNKVTVKDLARNIHSFRFYNQSNRKFITSNVQITSNEKV